MRYCYIKIFLLIVLYNSEITHSFISYGCVQYLGLNLVSLSYQLSVSTHAKENIFTSIMCKNFPFTISDKLFEVNLEKIDIILVIDFHYSDSHIFVIFSLVLTYL